eukprot:588025-Prymnesium_polylepis.3
MRRWDAVAFAGVARSKKKLGFLFPVVKFVMGGRTTAEGCQTLLHIAGLSHAAPTPAPLL